MTKLQNLLVKFTRQPVPPRNSPSHNVSIPGLHQVLIFKTWSVYRKEIDGFDYPSEYDNEEFIFLPNHKAHHQFCEKPGKTVTAEMIAWHLGTSFIPTGPGIVLCLNGTEYKVITITDTCMVWVAAGVFFYLRPASQTYPAR